MQNKKRTRYQARLDDFWVQTNNQRDINDRMDDRDWLL